MPQHINCPQWVKQRAPEYHAPGMSRKEKSDSLDKMQEFTGYGRKHLLRLLHSSAPPGAAGRPRLLTDEESMVLVLVWREWDCPCSGLLRQKLRSWGPYAGSSDIPGFTPQLAQKLASVSVSTLERIVRKHRSKAQARRRTPGKKGGNALHIRKKIKLSISRSGNSRPGCGEADCAVQCDGKTGGCVWTLQVIDANTRWGFKRSFWGLSADNAAAALKECFDSSPLPFYRLHTDNGVEFMNHQVQELLTEYGIAHTRSRPGRSNDNARAEQFIFTNLRLVLGYGAYQRNELGLINLVNDAHMLMYNMFEPVSKLTSKSYIGGNVRRWHDEGQTPLDRAVAYYRAHGEALPEGIARMLALREKLNPFELRRELKRLIRLLDAGRAGRSAKKFRTPDLPLGKAA